MSKSIISQILPHAHVTGRFVSTPVAIGLQFILTTAETSAEIEAWVQDYSNVAHLLTSEERRTLCIRQQTKFLRVRRQEMA